MYRFFCSVFSSPSDAKPRNGCPISIVLRVLLALVAVAPLPTKKPKNTRTGIGAGVIATSSLFSAANSSARRASTTPCASSGHPAATAGVSASGGFVTYASGDVACA